jgi:transcriptional regulator with XRE-family HTH domain
MVPESVPSSGGAMTVGQQIRQLREEKGWSQAKLGVLSGTGPSGISQIETGRRNPSAATLQRIAAPAPSEEQRAYAEKLMAAGVSESTARGVAGLDHRPEEYWAALSETTGLGEALGRVEQDREVRARLERIAERYGVDLGRMSRRRRAQLEQLVAAGGEALETSLAQLAPDTLFISRERLTALLRAVEQGELSADKALEELTGVRA